MAYGIIRKGEFIRRRRKDPGKVSARTSGSNPEPRSTPGSRPRTSVLTKQGWPSRGNLALSPNWRKSRLPEPRSGTLFWVELMWKALQKKRSAPSTAVSSVPTCFPGSSMRSVPMGSLIITVLMTGRSTKDTCTPTTDSGTPSAHSSRSPTSFIRRCKGAI